MTADQNFALPDAELARLEANFPARAVALSGGGSITVRSCGTGPAVVCLHGIGSGAASWLGTAMDLADQAQVIAWDAPGYGESTPVVPQAPWAVAYADRLRLLLDSLKIDRCILVGHSLGALMAGAAAHAKDCLAERIARLVLISPARGYGAPEQAESAARVRTERLQTLDRLGVAGMAAERSARLVSDQASDTARAWVRWNMSRLNVGGYRQAVELLCGDDLLAYLPPAMPVRVLCGDQDVVTTPTACQQVATACAVPLELIADAGHACYVERPGAVAAVLAEEVQALRSQGRTPA